MKFFCCLYCSLFIVVSAMGQSFIDMAQQAAKDNEFQKATIFYWQALEQARSEANDELTYDIFRNLQNCYTATFKLDSAAWVFEKGEQFAKDRGNYQKYFDFKLGRAEIRYMQGRLEVPKLIFQEIIEDDNAIRHHVTRAHYRIANIYNFQSDSTAAYTHIKKALRLAEANKDTSILGGILETYAFIELQYGSAFGAIDLYKKAIACLDYQSNGFRLGSINRQIGYVFQALGNFDKAMEFGHIALSIAEKNNHANDVAKAESLLGELYSEPEDYTLAKEYFKQSLPHFSRKRNEDRLCKIYSYLAIVDMKLNLPESAIQNIKKARTFINAKTRINSKYFYYQSKAKYELDFGFNMLLTRQAIDSCRQIVKASDSDYLTLQTLSLEVAYYQKTGDYKTALMKKEEQASLSDKIRKRNQSQLVHDLEAKYQNEMLDKELVQLNSLNQLNESKLNQQNTIIWIIVSALLAAGLFSYFVFRLYRRVDAQKAIIDTALGEKELLLKEIHHRVKNNLQVISSLLALQSGYVQDDKAIEALKHGQDRVQSMALIHQDLYQADNLKGVNVQKYFECLVDNLLDSYQVVEGEIETLIEIDSITLDVDTMIPLGLVVNELISNALKHAFKGRENGTVQLTLKEVDQTLILMVRDNGVGLKSLDELSGDTFGFQMMRAFATKLKAQIEFDHKAGFEAKLLIKNYIKTT